MDASAVTFARDFPLPPGLPLTGWQTKDACGHAGSFDVAGDGTIALIHQALNARFVSSDASGVFRLYQGDEAEPIWPEIYLNFHNGKAVQAKFEPAATAGFRFEPTWSLDETVVSPDPMNACDFVSIIRAARAHRTNRFQDETVRVMVALALCDEELLKPVSPVNAWSMLSPEQLIAVTTWAR